MLNALEEMPPFFVLIPTVECLRAQPTLMAIIGGRPSVAILIALTWMASNIG